MRLGLNSYLLVVAAFLLQVPAAQASLNCSKIFDPNWKTLSIHEFADQYPEALQNLKLRASEKELLSSKVVPAIANIQTNSRRISWLSKPEVVINKKDVLLVMPAENKNPADLKAWMIDPETQSWINPTTVNGKILLADGTRLVTYKTDELAPGATYAWSASAIRYSNIKFKERKGSLDVKKFIQENLKTFNELVDATEYISSENVGQLGLYIAKSQLGREVLILATPSGLRQAHEGIFIFDLKTKTFEFANDIKKFDKFFLPDIQMSLFVGGDPLWQ
ncbi:hypothetical protein AZI86_10060 [Bdellovibrio bacteriovorus]|uniref:Uncharacterized protein n=1 Tax=Bdellovibrio bacteriovorus TaxID=959 RepID=A0A150WSB7_BDEBC|nr:hypothetical protein [Bdellovibrio bacteriovorus]KYG67330.1 hypothetical protein AZI86_10060 [Bdellovibrio bacteriovorus]